MRWNSQYDLLGLGNHLNSQSYASRGRSRASSGLVPHDGRRQGKGTDQRAEADHKSCGSITTTSTL